jgi:hypothetical protein
MTKRKRATLTLGRKGPGNLLLVRNLDDVLDLMRAGG